MSNLSFSDIVTSFTIWDFLSELSKPYTQMDIYKAGIIDSRGKFLKTPQDYKTEKERRSGNTFHRFVVILKRALLTSSDPLIRYTTTNPMAALNSLAEEVDALGGNGQTFLEHVMPLFEDGAVAAAPVANSVASGGIYGARGNPDETIVNPRAAKKHKKRVKAGAPHVGRRLLESLLMEAKGRVVETTGHMTHLGDFLYYGKPELAIKHLNAVHTRFRGRGTPNHKMSLKADGGMSIVIKKHKDGTPAVAYKSGAAEFTDEDQIRAAGKEHFTRELIPALKLAKGLNLKPGTAVQGDLLFTSGHQGTVQPNTITYHAPHGAEIGFAPHSQYSTDGLNLRKTSSHPDHSGLQAAGTFIPNLAITPKTKLSLTEKRHKTVTSSIAAAQKALAQKGTTEFLRKLPQDKKFHRMLQEYSNHAARTSGERTVEGLRNFIPVHMAKASQKNLSEKTKKSMVDAFHKTIADNGHHFHNAFTAHAHINAAKHALLDQFGEHGDQFELKTASGEHEGFVSSMGRPGATETQAKFVREGPNGFPAKNTENAIKRFGKAPEA